MLRLKLVGGHKKTVQTCSYHPNRPEEAECDRCGRTICSEDVRDFKDLRVYGEMSVRHYIYCPLCNEEMLLRDAKKFKLGMIYFSTVNILIFVPVLVTLHLGAVLWSVIIFLSLLTLFIGFYKESRALLSYEELEKLYLPYT